MKKAKVEKTDVIKEDAEKIISEQKKTIEEQNKVARINMLKIKVFDIDEQQMQLQKLKQQALNEIAKLRQ